MPATFILRFLTVAAMAFTYIAADMAMISPPRALAEDSSASSMPPLPDTISPQARAYLQSLPNVHSRPIPPAPDDLAAWKKIQETREAERLPLVDPVLQKYKPAIVERTIGGVPVLEIKPAAWRENGQVLVYAHGGAYTFFSARTSLPCSVAVADATGLRVISIDYTLAPFANWKQITDQVVSVIAGLQEEGIPLKNMAIYGDSAGGGLAPGAVLKMRDKGLGMPAAVILWSPWADITDTGDSYITLKDAEPTYLYGKHLKPSADAYAEPKDQKNPYVSPVYADFSQGFPPTLIQGGTREIFLSNFVRLYQALDTAGIPVKLDLYEGMPHVFQTRLAEAPEGQTALKKMKAFLTEHLGK